MSGLSYPLTANNGSLLIVSTYIDRVGQALLSSLQTRLEERVYRPEYGLDDQEFQTTSRLTDILNTIRQALETGLEGFDDVELDIRGTFTDDGVR